MRRIRDAISPQQQQQVDPYDAKIADAEAQMDFYLSKAVEAEKRGQPIPLTTGIAVRALQNEIEGAKRERTLMAELAELKAKVNQNSDPQHTINLQAYSSLDTHVKQGLDQLYGADETYLDQKRFQFDAITRQIGESLKKIMKDRPREWEQMRRDPEMLRRLAFYHLKKNIPPQAVKLIEQDNIEKTPMKKDELLRAFQEANDIQDPAQRSKIKEAIRRELLPMMNFQNAKA